MAKDPQLPADHHDERSQPKSSGIHYRWKPTWGWAAFGSPAAPAGAGRKGKPKRSKLSVDQALETLFDDQP